MSCSLLLLIVFTVCCFLRTDCVSITGFIYLTKENAALSHLILQFIIRQWDKSQRSAEDLAARAALPDRYRISAKPVLQLAGYSCVIDQHGDDLPTSVFADGRIKYTQLSATQLHIDRFRLSINKTGATLDYLNQGKHPQTLGRLEQGWIQCRYNWRYGVEEGGQFYWMYEDLILNASSPTSPDPGHFLNNKPDITHRDIGYWGRTEVSH